MSSTTIYTEREIVEANLRLLSQCTVCRVAVAYCGEGAYRFFPEKGAFRPADLRIIVDASRTTISRGLTNPNGIFKLLDLTNQLYSLPGLHAKVWVFDDNVALVGSVNLSESSIEAQRQLTVEVRDPRVVSRIAKWFDRLQSESMQLHSGSIRRLKKYWPKHRETIAGRRTRGRLPHWKDTAPMGLAEEADFFADVSEAKFARLLRLFRSNVCPYPDSGGVSCSRASIDVETWHHDLSLDLKRLMHARKRWGRDELEEMFGLAFTHGKAARLRKGLFLSQPPQRVRGSLEYLLKGPGDPYTRFEKVLDPDGSYKIDGMGEAGLSFLMYLWEPTKFAIKNEPVAKALQYLGVKLPKRRSVGQKFKDFTDAVKEIGRRAKLRSLARTDHFLDAIGKKHLR